MPIAADVILLDADAVRRALSRMAHELTERAAGVDDMVIVGILTRGWPLAQRLAEKLAFLERRTVPHLAIDVSLYRDDRTERIPSRSRDLEPEKRRLLAEAIDGKRVILVDDVLYTGRTVRAAMDALTAVARPQVIELAVLVDRGHRELPIRPDYVGKNVPTARAERVNVLLGETDGQDAVVLRKPGHPAD